MSQYPRPRPWTATALLFVTTAGALWAANPGGLKHNPKPQTLTQLRSPSGITEVGILAGAPYRIDIPNGWNHMLVVYFHGYAQQPVSFHVAKHLIEQQQPFLDRHYAIVQSAYSQTGWALPQAYPETEMLRQYFTKRFGTPRETYLVGTSMGGALVMVTLELNPKPYAGGLDLCGAVGATSASFDRRFAMRAAFDYYFPGLMPSLTAVPAGFEADRSERERVMAALRDNSEGAAAMRSLMGLHTDAELASDIAYFTYVIGDMQRRAGGNPFDNRNTIYSGTNATSSAADYDLNDKVRRYAAQPSARAYLLRHYTPTGRLGKPMLAVHTVYDPVVPVSQLAAYSHQVESAGFSRNLVQQYVHRDGHCTLRPDEIAGAFDELVSWTHGDGRPAPGVLKDPHPASTMHEQALRPALSEHGQRSIVR